MIENIREALEIGLNTVLNQGWTRSKEKEADIIRQALTSLDSISPSEDASAIALAFYNGHALPADSAYKFAKAIQAYAELYHEKEEEKDLILSKRCETCEDFPYECTALAAGMYCEGKNWKPK